MVFWRFFGLAIFQSTMRMVCLNATQLTGAGVFNLDHRPHTAVSLVLALAVALLSQSLALRGADFPRIATQTQAPPPAAEASVRDALQKYSEALESLDANAVKKVQPSIPVDNLAKTFKNMRELKVDIDAVRVLSIDGATARVSCRVTQTLTPKAGSRKTTAVTRVMRLRREANSWVIDGFER
jgi:hypothetical protein